jgi:hypothetical protein
MSKQFLAVGDYLINPELLTFAVLERGSADTCLRLAFATSGTDPEANLRLTGDAAREVLRWLRLHSVFLSTTGGFGSTGIPAQLTREEHLRSNNPSGDGTISKGWGLLDVVQTDGAERFLSRTGGRQ